MLILEVILPIFAKLRMKRQVEQTIWSAITEHLAGQIGKHRFLLARRALFHHPNHSLLMQDQKAIAKTGDLMKRG